MHTSCSINFPCPPSLWKASISCTWGLWWPQEATTSQGGAEGGWGACEEKPPPCFLPEPAMCLGLQCCVALLFWGAGEVNFLDLDSGLSPAAAKSASFKGFLWIFCLFPHRLHGHWGHPESQSSGQRKRRESKDGLCPQKRTYLCLLVSQEAGRSIRILGLLTEARHCEIYSCVQIAIFSWVPPKLSLQPGNQLYQVGGLSSVFLCQQPVHSAARQLFLEHKLTMNPAQEISGVVGG